MRFISLFSGIEAASQAWLPLGWECCAVAEIEPFPCAVLAHHYPDAPNLGDITKITRDQIAELGKIDLVVGGFPCQDVSVAGKRAGLKNDDGSATRSGLFFDAMRIIEWIKPRWVVIENVPGLFSSNADRDFAAVVGEMAGCEFDVPADGWINSGVAIGPLGLVEWTVLDAQYHGLAQRRRRVFLVRDSGNWADRPPLFLEPYRLQGHPAPRRETGERHAGTISARTQGGGGLGTDFDAVRRDGDNLIPVPHADISPALKARDSKGVSSDGDGDGAILVPMISHALSADGFDASEDGTGRETPLIPVTAPCLRSGNIYNNSDPRMEAQMLITVPVAFDCKAGANTGFAIGDVPGALRGEGHGGGHAAVAVAFHENQRGEITVNDTAGSLKCNGGKPGQGYPAVAVALRGREGGSTAELSEIPSALRASGGGGDKAHVLTHMQVRRLTPMECCRLQGFPDNYLDITVRNKPAADGPKYKSLGNSMAVPVMRYIGERIQAAMTCASSEGRE